MRGNLGSDLNAAGLCLTNQLYGAAGGDVSYMNLCIGVLCQHDVTHYGNVLCDSRTAFETEHCTGVTFIHYAFFYEGRLLIVVDDDFVEGTEIIQTVQQSLGALYEMTVIGESYSSLISHIAYLGQFITLLTLGEGTDDIDMDAGLISGTSLQAADQRGIIYYRAGIRHGSYAGEAAGSSGLAAGNEIFLCLLTWLTEVNMHINETGGNHLACCIYNLCTIGNKLFAYSGNLTVLYQYIGYFINVVSGVNYMTAFNQKLHYLLPPVSTRVKRAMRTATPFSTCS